MVAVTVAIATYGRGRHILPTLRSVQLQQFAGFEALVVGDGDTSGAGEAVAALGDPRFRFVNLPERIGAQGGPNNRALDEARAPVIAYLGHDDGWLPDHLSALLSTYAGGAAIVMSGIATIFAAGEAPRVRGLFAGLRSAFVDDVVAPPTALSHRTEGFPRWRARSEVGTGADVDLVARAMGGGLAAASTGRITALKWNAMTRYLSYVVPSSDEQADAVAAIEAGRGADLAQEALEAANAAGRVMLPVPPPVGDHAAGARRSDEARGLGLPPAVSVDAPVEAAQTGEYRARDWRLLDPRTGLRWSGDSARPRLYLPFVGEGPVRLSLAVRGRQERALDRLGLRLEDAAVPYAVDAVRRVGRYRDATLTLDGHLRRDRGLVLEFGLQPLDADDPALPPQTRGIAAGLMRATPRPG